MRGTGTSPSPVSDCGLSSSYRVEHFLSSSETFLSDLLDERHARLCRPYVREASLGFDLEHLATAFIKNPGFEKVEQATYLI
jgi:hypothetical protein